MEVYSKTANSPFGSIEATDQAAIIDGQHRLGGLSMIAHDGESSDEALHRNIPFMAVQFGDVKISICLIGENIKSDSYDFVSKKVRIR